MDASKQQIRFCTTADNVRIAYATLGNGLPLVKTANWLTHLEFDAVSPVWWPWLERLSRSHTVVRYDERGCGLSDRGVSDLSFEDWARDLEAVVDAAGLERFALLGLSQGGAVAVSYAAMHPERVSHLVLYGAYARGRLKRRLSAAETEEAAVLRRLVEVGWGKENPAFRQVFTSFFIPDGTMEHYRWFNDLQRVSAAPDMASRILATCDNVDVRHWAAKVRVPTLVLHARGDARVPFEEGRLLAGLIPGAQFVPLDSNNHALLHTEPAWNELFSEIDLFLSSEHVQAPPLSGKPTWLSDLTRRERQVLDFVARGMTNRAIAKDLSLSEKTIRNHLTRIFGKLGVSDRGRAIVRARDAGFGREPSE
jgi:pimeloyl-ACP methyl ester carboxylesterase/DNA-binding CsgD family transcriptional regulator